MAGQSAGLGFFVFELLDGFLSGRTDDFGAILQGGLEGRPGHEGADLAQAERCLLTDLVVTVVRQDMDEGRDDAAAQLADLSHGVGDGETHAIVRIRKGLGQHAQRGLRGGANRARA